MGSSARKSASLVPLEGNLALKTAAFALDVRAVIAIGEFKQKFVPLGIGKIAGRLTRWYPSR